MGHDLVVGDVVEFLGGACYGARKRRRAEGGAEGAGRLEVTEDCKTGCLGIVQAVLPSQGKTYVCFVVKDRLFSTEAVALKLAGKPPSFRAVPSGLMEQLWASRSSSGDVRLLPHGSDGVHAHACILEAASPVFRAALQSGMKEAASREVAIPDTSEGIVIGVLQILYINSMPSDLDTMSALAFVHKYHITGAAKFLVPTVVAEMTVDNVHDVVRFFRDSEENCDSGEQLLDVVLEKVRGDKEMLKRCVKLL